MKTLLKHAHLIIDGNKEYLDGSLLMDEEHIIDVYPHTNQLTIEEEIDEEIDLKGSIVMPGFFDTHLHGSVGYDFRDNLNLNEVANSLCKHGTTSFFATINGYKDELDILNKLNDLNTPTSRCLGIHLEGPFLSGHKAGVTIVDNLLKPSIDYVKELLNINPNIKQMTIAAELEGSKEVIDYLKQNNIRVMLGHSNAHKDDLKDIHYDGLTHFFNAMSGFHHHDLGLVNEGFNNEEAYKEVIGDGVHIDETVLKILLKNIRRDRIVLISDAISATGLEDGEYAYNNEPCIKKGNSFRRVKDNILSGSVSFISDEIKVMRRLGASLTDILLMSSLNAYRLYGLDNLYGTLNKGKASDLVILDGELNVKEVFVRGKKNA